MYPYINVNDPFAAVERYLARGIAMNGLAESCMSFSSQSTFVADFTKPEQDIKILADSLNASFIFYAAGAWGNEGGWLDDASHIPSPCFIPNNYMRAMKVLVPLVNRAYDCHSPQLRRPIIQAGIFEQVTANVKQIAILEQVIEAFRDELTGSSLYSYYFDSSGSPLATLSYDINNIHPDPASSYTSSNTPDITRIEARMWLYQQALWYLDAGYTSLHMGQIGYMARLIDPDIMSSASGSTRTSRLHMIATLMTKIRAYAVLRPNIGFVVLAAEPIVDLPGNGAPIKYVDPNSGNLIFDIKLGTMRPRELNPLEASANAGCNSTINASNANAIFAGTPCGSSPSAQYQATIDPCHGINMLPDGGGYTGGGNGYLNKTYTDTPYSVYFDFSDRTNNSPGMPSPGYDHTYGYDDARWFSNTLTDPCRAQWIDYQLKNVRYFTFQAR